MIETLTMALPDARGSFRSRAGYGADRTAQPCGYEYSLR